MSAKYVSEIRKRIGTLYDDLANDDKSKIENTYSTYKEYLAAFVIKDQCPWFVNHGLSHINGVLDKMESIFERYQKTVSDDNNLISNDELYFLLCAVIYHDIGMAYHPTDIKNKDDICDIVREKHGEYSGILLNETDAVRPGFKDHDIVNAIMKYHQTKAPLNDKYELLLKKKWKNALYEPIDTIMKYDGTELKTELLAALLQLADACDIGKERVKELENQFREKNNRNEVDGTITKLIDDFTNQVNESEKNDLLFLKQTLNNDDLISANKIINSCKSLSDHSKNSFVEQIKYVKMILKQESHIEKHKSINDIFFNDKCIIVKLSSDNNEKWIQDIVTDIKDEVLLTETTFSKYLPNGEKLFEIISVINANNEQIRNPFQMFPKNNCGDLESLLENKSSIEKNNAWSKFDILKKVYLSDREKCDICHNKYCKDDYSTHCICIEQIIYGLIEKYNLYLKTDELFVVLCAIWEHEICNSMIIQNENFSDYKSRLNEFKDECRENEKILFENGSDCSLAHTDYIFDNIFETKYKNFTACESVSTFKDCDHNYEYDFNMPLLFWLLRYCELLCKQDSYCILDYPHWSMVALQRCWPIDFKQKKKNIPFPGNIATILTESNKINEKKLEGKAINEFLFVVLYYELNNMYVWAINNDSKHKINFENYELNKFDCSANINHGMYLQMCKDFASENNQLEKIFKYNKVNISEFDDELIQDTLLEVNGDYLCDIFMKSYKKGSSSDSTFKTDDSIRNFLHSDKCDYTGLKLNGTYDTSYLFSWDNVAENDYMKLIGFLKNKFNIEWVKTENISKTKDCEIIMVSNNEKSLTLKLNDDKTKVNLTIYDGRVDEFTVKTENGEINIHDTSIQINNIINELFENCTLHDDNLYKALYLYLAVYCNNECDIDWVYKVTKKTITKKTEGGTNIFDKSLSYSLGD